MRRIMYWLMFVVCVNSLALMFQNYLMFSLLGWTGSE